MKREKGIVSLLDYGISIYFPGTHSLHPFPKRNGFQQKSEVRGQWDTSLYDRRLEKWAKLGWIEWHR